MFGWWSDFRKLVSNITVEPVLFLFSMSHGFYVIVAQSLYIAKVCSVNLNYSRELCDEIQIHKEEQIEVQKVVSALQAYNSILQALPAIVYALFAGPWSDTHGRKLLIIWSCFGYIFNNGVYIINTVWWDELKAEYLLFECLQDCTGGYTCFFLGCYAYISDVSSPADRTRRLAFLDGLFPIGFFSGMALSGIIKRRAGFITNFALGIAGALLAMLYTIFVVKDSRKIRPPELAEEMARRQKLLDEAPPRNKLASLFDVDNLKKSFRTTFKKRQFGVRPYVLLLVVIFVLEIFLIHGKGPTMFLFLRKQFSWNEETFGKYVALFGIVGLFTQYVAVPFLTERGYHDTTLGFWGVVGSTAQCVITALAKQDWLVYFSGVVAFLSMCVTTTCRALVTKCVGPFEVGAVFSVMGAVQALVPLVGAPLYGFMYKATIDKFAGAFLIFTACVYVVVALLLISVNLGLRRVEERKKKAAQETETAEQLNKAPKAMTATDEDFR